MLREATRELLAKLPVAIAVIEPPGIMRWVNPRAEQLLGLPLDKLIDRLVYDIVHPDDRKKAAERVGALLAAEPVTRGQYRIPHPNGTYVDIDVESVLTELDGASYFITVMREV